MSAPTPPPQGSGGRNIGAEVQVLVTNVVNLANHLGATESAEALVVAAARADTTATVVVAGEPKQGKSSLINCLVGVEGLSPVDSDIATAVPVRFGYGREPTATVQLTTGGQLTITTAELPGWVSMIDADLAALRQVSSVAVEVPSPLLEAGMVLIDTPGVGGLVAGHAKMTLRTLEAATALLFVTDADTLLTGPELDFLARAGERIAAVVFVITKIDATPHWREVLAENRDVLARYAPRYADAPMLGVSARLAVRARAVAATDRPLSANLWAESGFGKLQSWVGRRIRPVAMTLAVANTVALARSALDGLGATVTRNLLLASADPMLAAALATEQARVAALRLDQLSWGTTLERRLFEARTGLRDQVKASSEDLRASAAELVKAGSGRDTKMLVAQIDAELDAQAADLSVALNDAAAAVCARMLEGLNIDTAFVLSVSHSGAVNVKPFQPAASRSVTVLTGGMAAATGWGLMARTVGLVTSGLSGVALPLLGAAGLGYAIMRIRGTATRRTEMGGWARSEIDRATSDRYADIERVLTGAKLDITEVVRTGLLDREREMAAALEEARAAKSRSEQQRVARERHDRKVAATVVSLTAIADELLEALLRAASLTAPNPAGRLPDRLLS